MRSCGWLPAEGSRGKGTGLLSSMVRRLIFAVPLRDVHSPAGSIG